MMQQKLSTVERELSRRKVLERGNLSSELWLFAYGSLMWNPDFSFEERHFGVLKGYHRDFCVWALFSRGTPDKPGLSLGLVPGGETYGYLYRLLSGDIEPVTKILWEREMISDVLVPCWVTVVAGDDQIEALTFIVDTEHEQYANLTPSESAPYILHAKGPAGSCLDYFTNTVTQLSKLGITDPKLKDINEYLQVMQKT